MKMAFFQIVRLSQLRFFAGRSQLFTVKNEQSYSGSGIV